MIARTWLISAVAPILLAAVLLAHEKVAGAPKPGEERSVEIADGVQMDFCWVPEGTAQLGSPKAERDGVMRLLEDLKVEPDLLASEAEGKRGKYSTKGFWLGKYPVTQEQWGAVMKANPSYFNGKKDNKAKGEDTSHFPVETVNWNDSVAFVKKVNERNVASKALGMKGKLKLPHEDEWEYAYRGGKGNKRPFYWGDKLNSKEANCNGTSPYGTTLKGLCLERTTKVGTYEKIAPHPWGLCDMAGNVFQWCENYYSEKDTARVKRGGSWILSSIYCRGAAREPYPPGIRGSMVGVRLEFRPD